MKKELPNELLDAYKKACREPSDIYQHITTLAGYSLKCESIAEFGVRYGVSTIGLLRGLPKKYVGYDLKGAPDELSILAELAGIEYEHYVCDVLAIDPIEKVDLLFIDTLHTYKQLSAELKLHGNQAKKYIILHDTTTYGEHDQGGDGPGMNRAVDEFCHHGMFNVLEVYKHNNGLTVLERIQE